VLLYYNLALMGAFHDVDGRMVWVGRKSYPKPDWPLATLTAGKSFLIPMRDGTDITGRSEQVIRAYITRHARESLTRFHVHRVDGGLLVIRSEKPPIHFACLR
jgi:hypothetical protein